MGDREIEKRPQAIPPTSEGQMVWIPAGYELVADQNASDSGSHLWDYIWLVWGRRWLVVLVFLFFGGLAAVTTLRATPLYEAVAKLRIEPDAPSLLSFDENASARTIDYRTDLIETQRQIIQNRTLARQVVEQLRLFADDEEQARSKRASPVSGFLSYLKSFASRKETKPARAATDPETAKLQNRVNAFMGSLTVNQVSETQILEVRFLADDPGIAAQAANALCHAYILWNYESRANSYKYAQEWLTQKTEALKAKLEESEERLYKSAGGKDILSLANNTEELNKQLEDTGLKLAEAERLLFEKEFLARSLESTTSSAAALADNPSIQKMLLDLADLEVKYDQVKAELGLGPEMSEIKALQAAIARKKEQLGLERQRAMEKARLEQRQAKAAHDFLRDSYEKQRQRIVEVQQRLIQYNILKREVDVNRELYNSLLQRSKEVGVASGLKAGNVSIVEEAEPPRAPKFPRKKRSVILGGFLGLFVGIGLAFFLDYMDTTVKSPEEVERLGQLATLGFLPHYGDGRRRWGAEIPVELVTHERPKSAMAENVRYLRTSIMYSLAGRSPKTILITSALPGEGKTTVAINLAIAFAQRGHKVLLVDADLKRPGVHHFFEVDRAKGLTEVLTGKLDGAAAQKTHIDNLFLLPSGTKPPNPVDLLDSEMMRDLLVSFSEQYDQVILDSAPMTGMADTTVLVPYVDGVVLVVRPGKTPRQAVRKVKEQLSGVRAQLLGVVFNNPAQAPGRSYDYGYSYGYRYAYLYGDGYQYGDEDESDGVEGAAATPSGHALPPPDGTPEI